MISKASITNGLIHTYTREVNPDINQAWYWATIDFRTGATQYKQLAGAGPRWTTAGGGRDQAQTKIQSTRAAAEVVCGGVRTALTLTA